MAEEWGEEDTAFDRLQQELSQQIDEAMTRTRQQLLENFDAEVIEKLRISRDSSTAYLDQYERMLMELTHHELRERIEVLDGVSSFQLTSCPFDDDIPLGIYELPRRSGEAYLYRLSHPLAQHVLSQAKGRALPPAEITFDYTNHLPIISILKPLVGQEGSLRLSLFTIESLDQVEDYLIIAALADNGQPLDAEQASRLLRLPAMDCRHLKALLMSESLDSLTVCRQDAILQSVSAERGLLRGGSARSRNSIDRSGRHDAPPQPRQHSRKSLRPRNTSNLLRPTVILDGARYLTPRMKSTAIVSSLSLRWRASSGKKRRSRSCSLSGGK